MKYSLKQKQKRPSRLYIETNMKYALKNKSLLSTVVL